MPLEECQSHLENRRIIKKDSYTYISCVDNDGCDDDACPTRVFTLF
jgi:hypothetical protein